MHSQLRVRDKPVGVRELVFRHEARHPYLRCVFHDDESYDVALDECRRKGNCRVCGLLRVVVRTALTLEDAVAVHENLLVLVVYEWEHGLGLTRSDILAYEAAVVGRLHFVNRDKVIRFGRLRQRDRVCNRIVRVVSLRQQSAIKVDHNGVSRLMDVVEDG